MFEAFFENMSPFMRNRYRKKLTRHLYEKGYDHAVRGTGRDTRYSYHENDIAREIYNDGYNDGLKQKQANAFW